MNIITAILVYFFIALALGFPAVTPIVDTVVEDGPSYNIIHQSVPKSEPESIPETAEQLNISISAVKKSMKEIVNVGILVRVGANKGGDWEVKNI